MGGARRDNGYQELPLIGPRPGLTPPCLHHGRSYATKGKVPPRIVAYSFAIGFRNLTTQCPQRANKIIRTTEIHCSTTRLSGQED